MTRFARAKGSKASNERLPNEPTPWHVMKQQLEQSLSKNNQSPQKTKSAKELLAINEDLVSSDNIRNSWAEFESNSQKKDNFTANQIEKKQRSQFNRDKNNQNDFTSKNNNNVKLEKKFPIKRKNNEIDDAPIGVARQKLKKGDNEFNNKSLSRGRQQHNKKYSETDAVNENGRTGKSSISQTNEQNDMSNNKYQLRNEKNAFSKRQKRNRKHRKGLNESESSGSKSHANKNESESKGNNLITNRFNTNFTTNSRGFQNMPRKFGAKNFESQQSKKAPKIRDDKEHKRRKPDLGPLKVMINGIEVEIVKFEGFPVKKEDADRLTHLKQNMIMKGIPKKEIDAAMKLERRKAEKALARIRKCVCFHCRKAGHNLSDCPELGSEQAGTGICFKCGSTEHTHFECKVARPMEFRYATCFICREQGHIAKQCPDNPKGVYPEGGSCKICGDVTHLKKDCPNLITEKEENAVTVNMITNGDLETLEGATSKKIEDDRKFKKIVKF